MRERHRLSSALITALGYPLYIGLGKPEITILMYAPKKPHSSRGSELGLVLSFLNGEQDVGQTTVA